MNSKSPFLIIYTTGKNIRYFGRKLKVNNCSHIHPNIQSFRRFCCINLTMVQCRANRHQRSTVVHSTHG